jgi:hypothetical protein
MSLYHWCLLAFPKLLFVIVVIFVTVLSSLTLSLTVDEGGAGEACSTFLFPTHPIIVVRFAQWAAAAWLCCTINVVCCI